MMGETRKRPKVLRWFVLWIVFSALAAVSALVVSPILLTAKLAEAGEVVIDPTTRFAADSGDYFGLETDDGTFSCTVRPDSGEERELPVSEGHGRHRMRETTFTAWFSGSATVTCERRAELILPSVYQWDRAIGVAPGVLLGLGGASLLFGFFRLWQRSRRAGA
ncbi:hypothetical protein [Actinokineospora sp. HUAS TT18]|uniref:hypothetical protein n=1 Tax=Actinokineospora sp. HUAS TT18 TaxID=3447451 RepID=UPI003F525C40